MCDSPLFLSFKFSLLRGIIVADDIHNVNDVPQTPSQKDIQNPPMKEQKQDNIIPTDNATILDESDEETKNVDRIVDLGLTVNVNMGTLSMTLKDLLDIVPGAIIELGKKVDEPLELLVSNTKPIAKGEVVTIGENLGLRVLETL